MNNNRYIVSLDAGKDSVKLAGINANDEFTGFESAKRVCFKTRTYDLNKGYIDVQGNSHEVVFNKNHVIIGEQGTDRSLNTSKTEWLHQIAAYTAITQLIEPNTKGNLIDMALACPITVLLGADSKNTFRDFIKGKGPIKINVDGENYEFTINNVLLKAEGSGVLYVIPEMFRNKRVIVIDFGGLNMTVSIFTNGACVNPETDRFAKELGSVELVKEVQRKLIMHYNGNMVEYDTAEKALHRGYDTKYGKKQVDTIEVIENAKAAFFNKAMEALAYHKATLDLFDHAIFVGGTSLHLTKNIGQFENAYITDNVQWTTTEGLLRVAVKKFK